MAKKVATKKATGVRVDVVLWKKFRLVCLEQDRTAADVMNELIAGFVTREAKGKGKSKAQSKDK